MKAAPALAGAAALGLAACGLSLQSPDLFVLSRIGQGTKLTLLVNDSGTIRCAGAAAKPLPDPLLLRARDLAKALAGDAKAQLLIRSGPRTIYSYSIKLQDGTISFPDTAASDHPELAQAELFALDASHRACGFS
jgi:hypothetical protein